MDITKELLLNVGWSKHLIGFLDYVNYEKSVCNCHLTLNPSSCMKDRNWYIHVDNEDFQTIGGCSIQTVEHFNKFMELLDIDYKL